MLRSVRAAHKILHKLRKEIMRKLHAITWSVTIALKSNVHLVENDKWKIWYIRVQKIDPC